MKVKVFELAKNNLNYSNGFLALFLIGIIRNLTIKKVEAIEKKLCIVFHDFLYLTNFVFFSSQYSAIEEGILNNKHCTKMPFKFEFLVVWLK